MNVAMRSEKRTSVLLERGLYTLHYAWSSDAAQPPVVELTVEAGRQRVVLHPDERTPVLKTVGSAIAVVVTEKSRLHLLAEAANPSRPAEVRLDIEELSLGRREPTDEFQSSPSEDTQDVTIETVEYDAAYDAGYGSGPASPNRGVNRAHVVERDMTDDEPPQDDVMLRSYGQDVQKNARLLGHVAYTGDTAAKFGQWLSGPKNPAPIEGIALDLSGLPAELSIKYGVRAVSVKKGSWTWARAGGDFVGTRGKKTSLGGATFELTGPARSLFAIEIEAMFSGAPLVKHAGRVVVCEGPTGREPLIGLRLSIAPRAPKIDTREPASAKTDGGRKPMRIFRI